MIFFVNRRKKKSLLFNFFFGFSNVVRKYIVYVNQNEKYENEWNQ